MSRFESRRWLPAVMATLLFALTNQTSTGQGIALTGVGPVNRSMGGASTAAPIDAMGALHWNPAAISGLDGSEVSFGMELLLPTEEISSTFGPFSGSDQGEPGVSVIPALGWVHKEEGSRWTVGLGMYGIGGFRTNYPASTIGGTNNPVLFDQTLGGLGQLSSEAEFLQIVPTLSYAITDRLSVGIAPTLTLGKVSIDPLLIASPVGGIYSSGRMTRWHFGGGVQAGIYYIACNDWHFGASIKSTQWFENFRYFTSDGAGGTRVVKYDLDYPMIVSLGAAYNGIENLMVALDVRYFDYGSTDGFGSPGTLDGSGALQGLDWSSLVSVATGAQYKLNDCLYLRMGYTYQQNPIKSSETFVNVASPLIIEHVGSIGVTYKFSRCVDFAATYVHGFQNSSTGPMLAGGTVTSDISADALAIGVTVKY